MSDTDISTAADQFIRLEEIMEQRAHEAAAAAASQAERLVLEKQRLEEQRQAQDHLARQQKNLEFLERQRITVEQEKLDLLKIVSRAVSDMRTEVRELEGIVKALAGGIGDDKIAHAILLQFIMVMASRLDDREGSDQQLRRLQRMLDTATAQSKDTGGFTFNVNAGTVQQAGQFQAEATANLSTTTIQVNPVRIVEQAAKLAAEGHTDQADGILDSLPADALDLLVAAGAGAATGNPFAAILNTFNVVVKKVRDKYHMILKEA